MFRSVQDRSDARTIRSCVSYHRRLAQVFGAFVLLLVTASKLCAEEFRIDWWDTGAGARSAGGPYSVSGSIGQADAGTLTGENFTLIGGFWGIVQPNQPPVLPRLSIGLTQTNTCLLSWPSSSTGFVLQECAELDQPNWSETGIAPTDDGTTLSVAVPLNSATRFYRLTKLSTNKVQPEF